MSNNLEKKALAFTIAESAYSSLKGSLKGNGLQVALATSTNVPQYINYSVPTPGTEADAYFSRNPLSQFEGMNVDFDNPPTPIGTRSVNGLLTPAIGVAFGSGGRYWVKITDNDDGDGDPLVDLDGTTYMRIMAVRSLGAGQVSTYGTTVKNTVSIIEAKLKRDTSFDLSSPFTVAGPDVNPTFNGNSFELNGDPHDINGNPIAGTAAAGFGVFYDNPLGGDAIAGVGSVVGSLGVNQYDNVVGDGLLDPSVQDDTNEIRNSPNQDATNILDPTWVMGVINRIESVADIYLAGGHYSGIGSGTWGTTAAPKITYIDGNLKVTGGGSGAGLLVVKGSLEIGGAFDYAGLILTLGGDTWLHGANKTITGGIFTADIIDNGDGTYSYGIPDVRLSGNSDVLYSGDGISLGYSLLPMKVQSWREITPELEPPF